MAGILLSSCEGDGGGARSEAPPDASPTPSETGEYVDQPVIDCQSWTAVSRYGPVTLRPGDPGPDKRAFVGSVCKVKGSYNVYRASFQPTGWSGRGGNVIVRVPGPMDPPIVVVSQVGQKPALCSLGTSMDFASVVVYLETDEPGDIRIRYPDPDRAARIDGERAGGELHDLVRAIQRCADDASKDQFNPPARCLDLARLRAEHESLVDVRADAKITRSAASYDITVPFTVNGRRMVVRETTTEDGMVVEHGELPIESIGPSRG